jgi:hypothetical protein
MVQASAEPLQSSHQCTGTSGLREALLTDLSGEYDDAANTF